MRSRIFTETGTPLSSGGKAAAVMASENFYSTNLHTTSDCQRLWKIR
jgi:hypothetical protein